MKTLYLSGKITPTGYGAMPSTSNGPRQSLAHDHCVGTDARPDDAPSLRGVETPRWVSDVGGGHQQQPIVVEAVGEDAEQPSADTASPGPGNHAEADDLEVAAKPCLGDPVREHLAGMVGPPLARLSGIAVGEANECIAVVGARQPEAAANSMLVPHRVPPRCECGVVTEIDWYVGQIEAPSAAVADSSTRNRATSMTGL